MPDSATRATTFLAEVITEATRCPLPTEVADRAKQHVLDGLIAVLSGATLSPGRLATEYARTRGGNGESTVAAGPRTNTESAAFANAIAAHADETDDVNALARVHPGASVVPAALAVAEAFDVPGRHLLNAISVGYDLTCAVNIGAWESFSALHRSPRTSHGLGQTFGAAAAAASLVGLSVGQNRQVLSYAAQQVAGIATIYRDPDHVGKAFTTAAMQAHAGVRAMELVRHGFTAIHDVFDGAPGVFDAFGEMGDVNRLMNDLSSNHHVMTTDIKQYPVGGPIQPAAEAVERIIRRQKINVQDVQKIQVRLPTHSAYIVDGRDMPDISIQYVLAVLLIDGEITFANSHDYERHHHPSVRATMDRIRVVADPGLDSTDGSSIASRRTWRAVVDLVLTDGTMLTERVDVCIGDHENPMSWARLAGKAHMVLDGVMPAQDVDRLVSWVWDIQDRPSVRELRPFLEMNRRIAPPPSITVPSPSAPRLMP